MIFVKRIKLDFLKDSYTKLKLSFYLNNIVKIVYNTNFIYNWITKHITRGQKFEEYLHDLYFTGHCNWLLWMQTRQI